MSDYYTGEQLEDLKLSNRKGHGLAQWHMPHHPQFLALKPMELRVIIALNHEWMKFDTQAFEVCAGDLEVLINQHKHLNTSKSKSEVNSTAAKNSRRGDISKALQGLEAKGFVRTLLQGVSSQSRYDTNLPAVRQILPFRMIDGEELKVTQRVDKGRKAPRVFKETEEEFRTTICLIAEQAGLSSVEPLLGRDPGWSTSPDTDEASPDTDEAKGVEGSSLQVEASNLHLGGQQPPPRRAGTPPPKHEQTSVSKEHNIKHQATPDVDAGTRAKALTGDRSGPSTPGQAEPDQVNPPLERNPSALEYIESRLQAIGLDEPDRKTILEACDSKPHKEKVLQVLDRIPKLPTVNSTGPEGIRNDLLCLVGAQVSWKHIWNRLPDVDADLLDIADRKDDHLAEKLILEHGGERLLKLIAKAKRKSLRQDRDPDQSGSYETGPFRAALKEADEQERKKNLELKQKRERRFVEQPKQKDSLKLVRDRLNRKEAKKDGPTPKQKIMEVTRHIQKEDIYNPDAMYDHYTRLVDAGYPNDVLGLVYLDKGSAVPKYMDVDPLAAFLSTTIHLFTDSSVEHPLKVLTNIITQATGNTAEENSHKISFNLRNDRIMARVLPMVTEIEKLTVTP